MRTTIAIDKEVAERAAELGRQVGHDSMTKTVNFLVRKACDFVEARGFNALIEIPTSNDDKEEE